MLARLFKFTLLLFILTNVEAQPCCGSSVTRSLSGTNSDTWRFDVSTQSLFFNGSTDEDGKYYSFKKGAEYYSMQWSVTKTYFLWAYSFTVPINSLVLNNYEKEVGLADLRASISWLPFSLEDQMWYPSLGLALFMPTGRSDKQASYNPAMTHGKGSIRWVGYLNQSWFLNKSWLILSKSSWVVNQDKVDKELGLGSTAVYSFSSRHSLLFDWQYKKEWLAFERTSHSNRLLFEYIKSWDIPHYRMGIGINTDPYGLGLNSNSSYVGWGLAFRISYSL